MFMDRRAKKPVFRLSRLGMVGGIAGAFQLGFCFSWEPWQRELGLELGFWRVVLEFPVVVSPEREAKLRARFEKRAKRGLE